MGWLFNDIKECKFCSFAFRIWNDKFEIYIIVLDISKNIQVFYNHTDIYLNDSLAIINMYIHIDLDRSRNLYVRKYVKCWLLFACYRWFSYSYVVSGSCCWQRDLGFKVRCLRMKLSDWLSTQGVASVVFGIYIRNISEFIWVYWVIEYITQEIIFIF